MVKKIGRELEIIDWSAARDMVKRVNPNLANIIDKINPGKKYKLIKAKYLFGDLIVNEGNLQLPYKGNLLPISDPTLEKTLTSLVDHPKIPLTILLNKCSEIFINDPDGVIPLKLFPPGELFGTFEVLNYLLSQDLQPRWSISAGSRSIFALPKLSETGSFKKLKSYFNLTLDQPRTLEEHWNLLKQITNSDGFTQPWISEVIFFSKEWFSFEKNKSHDWQEFQLFLFKKGWEQSQSFFEKQKISDMWRIFVNAISKRRLSPPPYLIDTLKHLFLISLGKAPAFRVVNSTELAAPALGLQNILVDVYGLKKYIPTLMHAACFNSFKKHCPLYYSLAFPTIFEGASDKAYRKTTFMVDLKQLKLLLDTVNKNTDLIPEDNFLNDTQFDFFHTQAEEVDSIKSSHLIFDEDTQFKDSRYPTLDFCSTSPFWRGCIKIS